MDWAIFGHGVVMQVGAWTIGTLFMQGMLNIISILVRKFAKTKKPS